MSFVDTGYLVALAQPRDGLHQRALAWAAAVRGPLVVTDHVLVETVNFLSRVNDRGRARLIAESVLAGGDYELEPTSRQNLELAVAMHRERVDKEWSLTDCISFQLMAKRGIREALAYDQHFEQAGFVALLRADPPST